MERIRPYCTPDGMDLTGPNLAWYWDKQNYFFFKKRLDSPSQFQIQYNEFAPSVVHEPFERCRHNDLKLYSRRMYKRFFSLST